MLYTPRKNEDTLKKSEDSQEKSLDTPNSTTPTTNRKPLSKQPNFSKPAETAAFFSNEIKKYGRIRASFNQAANGVIQSKCFFKIKSFKIITSSIRKLT